MQQRNLGPPGPSLGGDAILVANLPTGQLGGGDEDDGFGFDDFEIDNDDIDLPAQDPQVLMPPPPPANLPSPASIQLPQEAVQVSPSHGSPSEVAQPARSTQSDDNRTPNNDLDGANSTQKEQLPTAAVPPAPEKRCTDKPAGPEEDTSMLDAIPFPETEEQEQFPEKQVPEDMQVEGGEDEEENVEDEVEDGTDAQLQKTSAAAVPAPASGGGAGDGTSPEPRATGSQPSPGEHVSPTPDQSMEIEAPVEKEPLVQQLSAPPSVLPEPVLQVPASIPVPDAAPVQPAKPPPVEQTKGREQQTAPKETPQPKSLPFTKPWNPLVNQQQSKLGMKSRLGLEAGATPPPSAVAAASAAVAPHQQQQPAFNGAQNAAALVHVAHAAVTPSVGAAAAAIASGSTPLTSHNIAAKLMAAAPPRAATTPAPITPAFGPGAGTAAPTTAGTDPIRAPPPSPAGPEIQYDDPLLQFEIEGREQWGVLSSLLDDEAATAAMVAIPVADDAVYLENSTKELDAQAQLLLQELETMAVDMRILRMNYALDAAEAVAAVQVVAAKAAAAMAAPSASVSEMEAGGVGKELKASTMGVDV